LKLWLTLFFYSIFIFQTFYKFVLELTNEFIIFDFSNFNYRFLRLNLFLLLHQLVRKHHHLFFNKINIWIPNSPFFT
jgi:hypothetical protein